MLSLRSHFATCGVASLILFATASHSFAGGILFVDDDAPPGGDGTTWDTAYRFLQDALADAAGGGVMEIRVGQGTYEPDRDEVNPDGTGDREATFQLINGVAIMGGYAGIGAKDPDARDIELFETILSGDLLGNDEPGFVNNDENSFHVLVAIGTDESAAIHGLTIWRGNASGDAAEFQHIGGAMLAYEGGSTVTTCKIVENSAALFGGGIYSQEGPMILVDCMFQRNVSQFGGALWDQTGFLSVSRCTFEQNSATEKGGAILLFEPDFASQITECLFRENTCEEDGGAVYCQSSAVQFHGCSFDENEALDDGGAMYINLSDMMIKDCSFTNNIGGFGGAIATRGSHPTITDSTFLNNLAAISTGGAIWVLTGSLRMENCLVHGNASNNLGGGIYLSFNADTDWIVDIIDCVITDNSAEVNGGAVFVGGTSTVRLSNCTILGNSASNGGGFYSQNQENTEQRISNTILRNNQPNQIALNNSLLQVNHSDVQFGWPGVGNIDADPLFVDPDNGDYRLMPGSPCIDAGNNWGVPVDVDDYDEDGILCELFPADLDSNPRFNADEVDSDPGCGVPVVVDMGAYEYQFDPVDQVTFADLNGDDSVGAVDLLGLLATWGPCGKGCCLADLDLDGNVGASDLLVLLANWGPCL